MGVLLTLVWGPNVLDGAPFDLVGLVVVPHVDWHMVRKQLWREALPRLKSLIDISSQLHMHESCFQLFGKTCA